MTERTNGVCSSKKHPDCSTGNEHDGVAASAVDLVFVSKLDSSNAESVKSGCR